MVNDLDSSTNHRLDKCHYIGQIRRMAGLYLVYSTCVNTLNINKLGTSYAFGKTAAKAGNGAGL